MIDQMQQAQQVNQQTIDRMQQAQQATQQAQEANQRAMDDMQRASQEAQNAATAPTIERMPGAPQFSVKASHKEVVDDSPRGRFSQPV